MSKNNADFLNSLKKEFIIILLWVIMSAMIVVIAVKLPDILRFFQLIPNYIEEDINYTDLITWNLTSLFSTAIALLGAAELVSRLERNT